MGRHSTPDDEGGAEPRVVAVLDVATLLGRHSGSTGAIRRVHAAEVDAADEVDSVDAVDEEPAEAAARPGQKPRPALVVDDLAAEKRSAPENPADQVGLDLIEDALAAIPVEVPAEVPVEAAPEAHTAQIAPIGEPEPAVAEASTTQILAIEEPLAVEQTAPVAATPDEAPVDPAPKGARASSVDLALIRGHGDVRARCAAGLLVPFALYVVVLLLIGSFAVTTFLLWIWIPLISAGILVGHFLDSGHKRYGPAAGDAVSESPDRP